MFSNVAVVDLKCKRLNIFTLRAIFSSAAESSKTSPRPIYKHFVPISCRCILSRRIIFLSLLFSCVWNKPRPRGRRRNGNVRSNSGLCRGTLTSHFLSRAFSRLIWFPKKCCETFYFRFAASALHASTFSELFLQASWHILQCNAQSTLAVSSPPSSVCFLALISIIRTLLSLDKNPTNFLSDSEQGISSPLVFHALLEQR